MLLSVYKTQNTFFSLHGQCCFYTTHIKKLDFAHILKRIHSKMSFSYSKTIKESVKKYAHTLIHHKMHF